MFAKDLRREDGRKGRLRDSRFYNGGGEIYSFQKYVKLFLAPKSDCYIG